MVRGLYTFAKTRCPGGINKGISIESRINEYKRTNNKTPIIAFDYKASIQIFTTPTNAYVCCAGREKLIRDKTELFFETLKNKLGCKLVFFLDGPIKHDKIPYYEQKTNTNYNGLQKIFNATSGIQLNNKNIRKSMILPIYYDNILEIAKRYGEIHIAFKNENDLDINKYAYDNEILALFAGDTDFVIMKGDYQIWLPDTINFDKLTIDCLNKTVIKKVLQLNDNQMPIFATFYGNTIIRSEKVQKLVSRDQFKSALYIRQNYPDGISSNDKLEKLSRWLYNNGRNGLSMSQAGILIQKSLNSYDIKTAQENTIEPIWLKEHVKITNSTFVYIVHNDILFTINIVLIPLNMSNTSKSYSQMILQLVLRQMGIILKDCDNPQDIERKIFYKPKHEEPFKIYKLKPHFPNFHLPPLQYIIECSNQNSLNDFERIRLLSWLISPTKKDIDINILQNIFGSLYFIPILILNYFVGEEAFSIWEADAILLTISKSIELTVNELKNYPEPINIPARPFYVSHVYAESNYYFLNALIVCGLSKCYKGGNFDGFIFQKVYTELMNANEDQRNKMMKSLQCYRIYAK